jgi:double zinc ribbon protein/adenylate/guanylate cyclase family protein
MRGVGFRVTPRASPPLTHCPPADDNFGQRRRRERVLEAQPGISCLSCGYANRPDRRFCTECGHRLGRACAACAAATEAEEKFCGNCGAPLGEQPAAAPAPAAYTPKHLIEKVLTSRSALEGERKQVTVLFADVKGSMDLAEQVDAEEWHHIMERFFKILSDGVHRFEGTVNQYTGDGIMALFGAPIAHEDHAQRACYTVLSLQQDLRRYANELRLEKGINFSVRMASTPAKSSSARSATIFAWTTRPSVTRRASQHGWSRSRRRTARI